MTLTGFGGQPIYDQQRTTMTTIADISLVMWFVVSTWDMSSLFEIMMPCFLSESDSLPVFSNLHFAVLHGPYWLRNSAEHFWKPHLSSVQKPCWLMMVVDYVSIIFKHNHWGESLLAIINNSINNPINNPIILDIHNNPINNPLGGNPY